MTQQHRDPLYHRHRFPSEIIAHAVWLYFRFPLSLRMIEDLLAARGIPVSHQTIRTWAEKFGRNSPIEFAAGQAASATNGILMKSFSAWRQKAMALACGGSGRLRPHFLDVIRGPSIAAGIGKMGAVIGQDGMNLVGKPLR